MKTPESTSTHTTKDITPIHFHLADEAGFCRNIKNSKINITDECLKTKNRMHSERAYLR